MTECITYIIDYSENEDFRKKCFQLLRYDLETKILSNTKCEIQFILSSIQHNELDVTNDLNYPGTFEWLLFRKNKNTIIFLAAIETLRFFKCEKV